MIRRIRDLLYDQGFTISGARNKLQELVQSERDRQRMAMGSQVIDIDLPQEDELDAQLKDQVQSDLKALQGDSFTAIKALRKELTQIRDLLS